MKLDIYNIEGKKTSKKANLDKGVFEVQPNEHCIYLAIKAELAAKRQGTSASKNKANVRGTGAKPWKQKGTGRARAGRLRNPSRVHGGTAFGPEPREYNLKINKKVKKIARISALSDKCLTGNILVLDQLKLSEIKTQSVENILKSLNVNGSKISFLSDESDQNFYLSCRNLKNVNMYRVQDVTIFELMNSNVLVVDEKGLEYFNTLGGN